MKNTLLKFTMLALTLVLAGCVTRTGNQFDSADVAKIVKGTTTKAQLVSWFGQPRSTSEDGNGDEQLSWIGTVTKVKGSTFIPFAGGFIGGSKMSMKSLSVTLNKAGIVQDYRYSQQGQNSDDIHSGFN